MRRKRRNQIKKAKNRHLSPEYLDRRTKQLLRHGYGKTKWIEFSETLLKAGFTVTLYEAKNTYSKYLTIIREEKRFKVRFSNHKPNKTKEELNDCDFFVGVCNLKTTTTNDALWAVKEYFDGVSRV